MDVLERRRIVNDLIRDVLSILESLSRSLVESNHPNFYEVLDWGGLLRLKERLVGLIRLMESERVFVCAVNEFKGLANSDRELAKWSLPVFVSVKAFIKDTFLKEVDDLIDSSRSTSFEDYRAKAFLNELNQKLKILRDDYKEIYNL